MHLHGERGVVRLAQLRAKRPHGIPDRHAGVSFARPTVPVSTSGIRGSASSVVVGTDAACHAEGCGLESRRSCAGTRLHTAVISARRLS
jgi:hypothetical protein